MFVWTIILASHTVYQRRRPHLQGESAIKMPGGLFTLSVVLAFLVFIALGSDDPSRRPRRPGLHPVVVPGPGFRTT